MREIEWTSNVMSSHTPCGHPVVFDLNRAVKRWVRHPQTNLGIEIEVEDRHENKVNPTVVFKNLVCVNGKKPSFS